EESRALVNYFAAASRSTNPAAGITYPYLRIGQRDPEYWKRRPLGDIEGVKKGKEVDAPAKEARAGRGGLAKKELAEAEATLSSLKKSVADARDKKAPELAEREKALKAQEERVKHLRAEVKKDSYPQRRKRWEEGEVYAVDAYKLALNKNL